MENFMELNKIRQKVTAAQTNARIWAERMEWTVRKFDKAGLRSIRLVRGYQQAGELIEDERHVLLGQLGEDYLVGELKE